MFSLPSIHDELRHQIPSPVKESNLKEENCRKNYFPVPWRVIGGGVRVGITEMEDSDLYSTANASRPVNPASKLESDTPTKIVSRKRSNSNPPTPSSHSLQFKVEHVCPLRVIFFGAFKFTNFYTHMHSYSLLNLPACCDSLSLKTFLFWFLEIIVLSTFLLVLCNEFSVSLYMFFVYYFVYHSNLYSEPFLSSGYFFQICPRSRIHMRMTVTVGSSCCIKFEFWHSWDSFKNNTLLVTVQSTPNTTSYPGRRVTRRVKCVLY